MKKFLQLKNINFKKLWFDIKESVRGTEQDFTEGNLYRAIILLSIPMVLEMVGESIFAIVDIIFISKISSEAVATVGLTETMMTIVYAIGFGLAVTATTVVSRRIGEKKPKEAANAATQVIIISVFVSLIIGIIGILFSKDLLRLMGGSTEIIENGYIYTSIILGTNIVIILLFVINGILRSSGDAAVSMKVLWLANIINIILDPCLIFGIGPIPALGLKGAAIATSIGRGVAVLFQIYILLKGNGRIKIVFSQIKIDFKVIKKILILSRGSVGQFLISTTSWIGLVRIIAVFGSEVIAGYTIAIRIIIFTILPSWGLSNAAATLVGQNLGANKIERAERSVWLTGFVNMAFLSCVGILFIFQPDFFMSLLTSDPVIIGYGATCLQIVGFGFVPYSLAMVLTQAFNGAGDTSTPLKINFFCFWMFEVPVAWLMAIEFGIGVKGAYIAIVLADTLMVIIGIILFRKGKWKTKVV